MAIVWNAWRMYERVVAIIVLSRLLLWLRRNGLRVALKSVMSKVLAGATSLPGVSGVVSGELDKEIHKIEQNMLGDGDPTARLTLPAEGLGRLQLLGEAKDLVAQETGFATGKLWGGVYHDTREEAGELPELQCEMFKLFNNSNALFPGTFPSIRKFEAEIVTMAVDILHGTEKQAAALLTSGGTESVLLGVQGYRQEASLRGITQPEVICCITAHPAIDKACHYFGIKLIKVPAHPETQQLTCEAVLGALNANTILVYASAPTFPHGVVDPIEDLAVLCRERKLGLHVDNCLGGFWLSFMQKEGLWDKMKWDFQVDGVTSISMDIHKYGFASKGSSVVAFHSKELRRHTFCPVMDGTALYITPTLQGSRSGATIAGAWATMLHMGDDGYRKAARHLHELHAKLKQAIVATPGLHLVCDADLCIVPIASDEVDVYSLASLLERRGWNMFTATKPKCMTVCIGERHSEVLDMWIDDMESCLEELRSDPSIKPEGDAAVYGATSMLPEGILETMMKSYVDIKLTAKPKEA